MNDTKVIDQGRRLRLTWLESMVIPQLTRTKQDGRVVKVHPQRTKHVLRAIESHARNGGACRLKLAEIAKEMAVSPITVSKGIRDCIERGLLTADTTGDTKEGWKYQIQWDAIRDLAAHLV